LRSDRAQAQSDLANEATDIDFGDGSKASQRCYILVNNVRYDVEERLDHHAGASASSDAASLQTQLDAKWQELVNLQHYSQDFSNNGVAPFGGAWATTAVRQMIAKMKATAAAANKTIGKVNGVIDDGFKQYRLAWMRWNCPISKLLLGQPRHVPVVQVKRLPKPNDP
jgi:hypothetical protein